MRVGKLTVQPASDATGPSFLLMDPPALNKAISTPLKLQFTQNYVIGSEHCEACTKIQQIEPAMFGRVMMLICQPVEPI